MRPPQICASIAPANIEHLNDAIQQAFNSGANFVEIRFDYLPISDILLAAKSIELHKAKCVFTLRSSDQGGKFQASEGERVALIKQLSEIGPMLIDIELDALNFSDSLADYVEHSKTKVLVSWHDFKHTPPFEELSEKLTEMRMHSNFVKMVTVAKTIDDSIRLLDLYDLAIGLKPIIFAMGELGIISRILCTMVGDAPFTYASLGAATAPGQLSVRQLRLLYSKILMGQESHSDSSLNYMDERNLEK